MLPGFIVAPTIVPPLSSSKVPPLLTTMPLAVPARSKVPPLPMIVPLATPPAPTCSKPPLIVVARAVPPLLTI